MTELNILLGIVGFTVAMLAAFVVTAVAISN
ncbi:hypothetical protein CP357_07245 [Lactobacillus sp. UMNPBX6]|jgi:hypothetical protein|nr:hypothetical protein CP368_03760 [Lactobacillus sp. UMNPBX17]PEG86579.1 hypothetical protein CP365_07240 [Lactobacillus sp. UMNPBX14]PEH02128.1 hypothetical protein CP357_07245 [Lactobacillus sp. UMNPBX6]PEH06980.1 hypothetical protein CP355_00570 [Lactobacillus sp. UMNPBX4]